MPHGIDEFESFFRRAEREPFIFEEVPIGSVAVVTDGSREAAESLKSQLIEFLPRLETTRSWELLAGGDFANVGELLERIEKQPLDLIATYRHLHEGSLLPQHSLGVYVDVLTQSTHVPVLLLPGTAAKPIPLQGRVCQEVMVVTDHISGDSRLINCGARMCGQGSELWLCHVEDDAVFQRYMHAIERIPEIDTGPARELIQEQLLKEAANFIETCIADLREKLPNVNCHASVTMGHHLAEYRQLVQKHDIDLVVANTKDEDQLAMHGMSYALAVEMIDTAQLLL